MTKHFLAGLAALALAFGGISARADPPMYAQTVVTCGTPNNTPVVGNSYPVTQDTVGKVCVNAAVTVNPGTAATPASTSALATAKVIKASAGTLYSFQVSADSTLSAAAWWVMIFNATSDPGNGAVTPTKCFAAPSGTTALGGTYTTSGVAFSTGITIVVSTTGCFTETQSAHAFISGDAL